MSRPFNSDSPAQRAHSHVRELHAYVPGQQPEGEGWIKLNTNESPYPPSPRVIEAIRQEDGDRLRLYPDPRSTRLREAVARLHELDAAQVCIGNGSDDLLNLIARCFAGFDHEVADTLPGYSLYPVLVGILNGRIRRYEFTRGMRLPVDDLVASGANLLFLTTPNAPTGVAFSEGDLRRLAKAFPGILVFDEAYADFADENAARWVKEHPRLVVTRTLSKSYGLAGIRCGYALGHPDVIDVIDRVRDVYNVNRITQAAALAAIEDQGYLHAIVTKVRYSRDYLCHTLRKNGWFVYPSATNFVFVEPSDAAGRIGADVAGSLFEYLRGRKILVRHFPSHALTAGFLRISVGADEEISALLEAVDQWRTTNA